MSKKRFLTPFALSLVLSFTVSSNATTVQRLGLEDLVKKAHTIVVGRVTGSRTYWTPDHKIILTNYTIAVNENIKGQPSSSIEVTTIGGKIGDLELQVSGMPSFQKGENAVVFVEESRGYQTIVGLSQGKFTVTNGEVSNTVDALSFPDGKAGNPMKMPLQNFKNRIRSLLNQ